MTPIIELVQPSWLDRSCGRPIAAPSALVTRLAGAVCLRRPSFARPTINTNQGAIITVPGPNDAKSEFEDGRLAAKVGGSRPETAGRPGTQAWTGLIGEREHIDCLTYTLFSKMLGPGVPAPRLLS